MVIMQARTLKDFYQYITFNNISTGYKLPITCRGSQFNFKITLPYQPSQLTWDFNNNPLLIPNNNIVINNPVADSSFTKDGRTLYLYKVPQVYSYNGLGTVAGKSFGEQSDVGWLQWFTGIEL
jgi:hypothetical protein